MKPRDASEVLIETIVLKRDTFCIFLRAKHPLNVREINKKENATKELEKIVCSEMNSNIKNNFRMEMRVEDYYCCCNVNEIVLEYQIFQIAI